jgi:hypothetical protein
MGWKSQNAYDDAERARQASWLASLPLRERVRVRLGQTFNFLILFAAVVAAAWILQH